MSKAKKNDVKNALRRLVRAAMKNPAYKARVAILKSNTTQAYL